MIDSDMSFEYVRDNTALSFGGYVQMTPRPENVQMLETPVSFCHCHIHPLLSAFGLTTSLQKRHIYMAPLRNCSSGHWLRVTRGWGLEGSRWGWGDSLKTLYLSVSSQYGYSAKNVIVVLVRIVAQVVPHLRIGFVMAGENCFMRAFNCRKKCQG